MLEEKKLEEESLTFQYFQILLNYQRDNQTEELSNHSNSFCEQNTIDVQFLAKKFDTLYQQSEENFSSSDEISYYLLSTTWLEKFKQYVSDEKVLLDSQNSIEKCQRVHPGEFNIDLIESNDIANKFTKNIDGNYYSNVVLKKNLVIEKDFILIDKKLMDFINKLYSGIIIERKAYRMTDGFKKIEIYLKQMKCLLIFNDLLKSIDQKYTQEFTLHEFQFSGKTTLKQLKIELKDTLGKILDKYINQYWYKFRIEEDCIRFWLLDSSTTLEAFFSYVRNICNKTCSTDYKIQFKGKYLGDVAEQPLEDLSYQQNFSYKFIDFLENEYLVIDIRQQNSTWNLIQEGVPGIDRCEGCYYYKELNFFCECKKAAYCSESCRQKDLRFHSQNCEIALEISDKEDEETMNQNSIKGLCGLNNLGNTCFMNSALQCLSNCQQLTQTFLEGKWKGMLNANNPLASKGNKLAKAYASLIKHLWIKQELVFSPIRIKKLIGNMNPCFRGYEQQDSSEFLSYLLDGLHEDLNLVQKKPVTEKIDSCENKYDLQIATHSWKQHLLRNNSIVVDNFHGLLRSRLECPDTDCQKVSITFDPFLILPLPIPLNENKKVKLDFLRCGVKQQILSVNFGFHEGYSTVANLFDCLKKEFPDLKNLELIACYATMQQRIAKVKETVLVSAVKRLKKKTELIIMENNLQQEENQKMIEILIKMQDAAYFTSWSTKKVLPLKVSPQTTLAQLRKQVIALYWTMIKTIITAGMDEAQKNIISKITDLDILYDTVFPANENQLQILWKNSNSWMQNCYYCGNRCNDCSIEHTEDITLEQIKEKLPDNHQIEIELKWKQIPYGVRFENIVKPIPYTDSEQISINYKESAYIIKSEKTTKMQTRMPTKSIYDCLQAFQEAEILGQGNEWYCGHCKQFKNAKKEMKIFSAPNILILQLKRFKHGENILSSNKIQDLIEFPIENLDLTDFLSIKEVPPDLLKNIQEETKEEIQIETQPKGQADIKVNSEIQINQTKSKVLYNLYAISNHVGQAGFGHYTAYCKNYLDGKWYEFNDSSVSKVSENQLVSREAYLLFYEKQTVEDNPQMEIESEQKINPNL